MIEYALNIDEKIKNTEAIKMKLNKQLKKTKIKP